jgi:hypothetical protein
MNSLLKLSGRAIPASFFLDFEIIKKRIVSILQLQKQPFANKDRLLCLFPASSAASDYCLPFRRFSAKVTLYDGAAAGASCTFLKFYPAHRAQLDASQSA